MKISILITLLLFCIGLLPAQITTSPPKMIVFYNVENLFEPNEGPSSQEEVYRYDKPSWNYDKYTVKLRHIAKVLKALGKAYKTEGPDIIGLAEIQNRKVIQDLSNHPYLATCDYGIIHYDSPDHRGIDVGLLYKRSSFIPIRSQPRKLLLRHPEGFIQHTRDVLVVSGYFEQEIIHILVNHWPSRRGGESRSSPLRTAAAELNRKIIDSLKRRYSDPFIITMGDFNDDPTDNSLYHILGGREKLTKGPYTRMINPMIPLHRKGLGSLAYRDRWHLFDQILITKKDIAKDPESYRFLKAGIFMPEWMQVSGGRYRGYPLRTYTGNTYTAGYSDHFPVYILFENNGLGKPDVVRNPRKD